MFYEQYNFFSTRSLEQLQQVRLEGEFADVENDADGISYPEICLDVPDQVRQEIELQVQKPINSIFLRRSPEGVHCPNPFHNDLSMGRHSLMLYLTAADHNGTGFVRHLDTGASYAPRMETVLRILQEDSRDPEAWTLYGFCQAAVNKACIFDAGLFHAAYPLGGYGQGEGARCVLTAFFD